MRPQSPKLLQTQTITTTRIISSPSREARQDSCSRLAKVTTCQTRPKATITTISNRPAIETRTVVLCNDKKCQAHENLIEQLTQENTRLNQRMHDLELQIDKYDGEQQIWMSTAIEIESMRKLLEETQKNHQQEVQYLNSEIYNFQSTNQIQEEKIKSLTSQIKSKQYLEEDYATLTQEMERYKFINQDKDDQLQQQEYRIKDYERQLQVGENVIEERNSQIQNLLERIKQYELEFETSNNVIHQLKQEISQKDIQNQQLLQSKDSLISNYKENLDLLEQRLQQESHLDNEKNCQISKLENQKEDLNKMIELLQSQLQDYQEQNNHLNEQLILSDQNFTNFQNSIDNQTKKFQIELQSQLNQHEQKNQEKFYLEEELYKTKQDIQDKDNLINSLNDQIEKLKSQIQEQEEKIQLLCLEVTQQIAQAALQNNNQLQNYLIINEELKNNLQQIICKEKQTVIDLHKEIENKNELLENLEQSKVQIEELEKNKCNLENEIQSQRQNFELQNTLNEEISQKSKELIESLQKQMIDLQQQKEDLVDKVFQLQNDTQIQIKELQDCLKQQQLKEENFVEGNQELQEQLLLQQLELQRIQNENTILKEKLQQQSQEIEKLNESQNLIFEDKLLIQEEQNKQIDQLQINIKDLYNQCQKLKSDLKLQNEINEELNKKNQFNSAQISHLQEVEQQLRYLNEQTNQQQKNLQKELENKNEIENTLKFKLETLLDDIKVKQMQLVELDRQLQTSDQTNQRQQIDLEEKINYLQNEVEMWKEKFVILNRDYHRVQEDLMMVQAEFEAFNKRGLELKNIKESACFEVRKSSLYKENIDVKASQTSISRLFKENI